MEVENERALKGWRGKPNGWFDFICITCTLRIAEITLWKSFVAKNTYTDYERLSIQRICRDYVA